MGLFDFMRGRKQETFHSGPTFEDAIETQQELLFGLRLFIRCVERMHSGNPALLELKRQNLRSIEQKLATSIDAAETLMRNFREEKVTRRALGRFKFPQMNGHPELEQIARRSEILLETFRGMFPGRPQSEELSVGEIDALLRAAAEKL